MAGPVVMEHDGATTTYLPGTVLAVRVVPPVGAMKGWGVSVLTCHGWETVATTAKQPDAQGLASQLVADAASGDAPDATYAPTRRA